MAWQDISSAPKDGTCVLVIDMRCENPEAGIAWFVQDVWSAVEPGHGVPRTAMYWHNPTHWRPLPEPPHAKEGGE